jgi:putative ABC transport system permease protein
LRAAIDPIALGMAVRDVRGEGLAASRGATDFGEYFTYFSFFLVASALLLAALFFRLAVEQRAREVGLLRAVGFSNRRVRRLFLVEGFALALAGSAIGTAGAVAYAGAMMYGLRTWWVGAVTTTSLTLHVSALSLAVGAAGTLLAAMACIWWTLRGLSKITERSLLAGQLAERLNVGRPFRGAATASLAFALLGLALMAASAAGMIDRTGAFFGAGTSLLVACLCAAAARLRRPPRTRIGGRGWPAIARLGLRNASDRPWRSVLAIGVIASATFILLSVDAFRKDAPSATDRHSGVGGYPLLVNLLLPIANDPNGRDGRDALGLGEMPLDQLAIEPFRVRPGDDASCLNLYEPANPRIMGVGRSFVDAGRFAFQDSIASTAAERANPWQLLNRAIDGGGDTIVPVVADANSMTYVLHKSLGEDIVVNAGGHPVRLRLVAALADSIFQSELLMSEANFLRLFPEQEGYQFLLVDTTPERAPGIAAAIEQGAGDLGADAALTVDRLAEFHAVENTYLSTFKTLGGLGLLVGTVGLAAVLLRNVLERRRELALLGATGYRRGHIFAIIIAENALLLACGLTAGAVCAAIAIAPAAIERGGRLPAAGGAGLLVVAVFAAGLLSSVLATRAALRSPLLESLRAE